MESGDKKILFSMLLIGVMFLGFVSVVSANYGMAGLNVPDNGDIKLTNGCGSHSVKVESYLPGEKVYIKGTKFNVGTYNWTITGQPGGASCEPGKIIATANHLFSVGDTGQFCFEAYTVSDKNCGEYSVDFGKKNKNYSVDGPTPVPEFGLIAGAITILGAIGVFFIVRRK